MVVCLDCMWIKKYGVYINLTTYFVHASIFAACFAYLQGEHYCLFICRTQKLVGLFSGIMDFVQILAIVARCGFC